MDKFTKQAGERLDYDIDLSIALQDGDTVASAVVTTDDLGLVLEDVVVNPTANIVKQWVSGGVDGAAYKLTCFATTTKGRVIEVDFIIKIKDR